MSLLWRTFTPVEEAVLSAVAKALPSTSAERFLAQVASINKVQRTLDWTEICFYSLRGRRVDWPESILFPNRSDFRLAIAEYGLGTTQYRTTVYAVAGHVFSFITRPSVKAASFGRVEKLTVRIVGDPLTPGAGSHDFRRFLPPSYVAYSRDIADGRDRNGWRVLEPDATYVVHLSNADYVVLAERDGEEWLVVPAREDAMIHHCVLGHDPRACPQEFAQCLER